MGKKTKFTECEIEVLLTEVETRKHVLFGSLKEGISNRIKKLQWQNIADAINKVGSETRTLDEVKKKWYDIKLDAKKRIAAYNRSAAGTGGGKGLKTPSDPDTRVVGIIGDVMLSGVLSEQEGDTTAYKSGIVYFCPDFLFLCRCVFFKLKLSLS